MKSLRVLIIIAILLALAGLVGFLLVQKNKQATADSSGIVPASSGSPQNNLPVPSDAKVTLTTPTKEIVIEASEYKFTPSQITVKKGETVKITLKNTGKMTHDWVVEKLGGASIDPTLPQGTNSITITPSQKGTFTTYCSINNHRSLGMVGKLIVQ